MFLKLTSVEGDLGSLRVTELREFTGDDFSAGGVWFLCLGHVSIRLREHSALGGPLGLGVGNCGYMAPQLSRVFSVLHRGRGMVWLGCCLVSCRLF